VFHGEAGHTWKEAVLEWANAARRHMKPSTLERYLVSLGQLRGIMDGLYVDQITTKTIRRVARRRGVTNATRNRDLTAVSAVLGWSLLMVGAKKIPRDFSTARWCVSFEIRFLFPLNPPLTRSPLLRRVTTAD
jgi:hypothetical protein